MSITESCAIVVICLNSTSYSSDIETFCIFFFIFGDVTFKNQEVTTLLQLIPFPISNCYKDVIHCKLISRTGSFFYFRYFKDMAKGETPPVKERLEMPTATQKTDTGLTPGLLRVLNKQV